MIIALGSVQFGFTFGYTSPTQLQLMEDLGLSIAEFCLFGSLVNVGAIGGAIASARIQSVGRKRSLLFATIPNIWGWLAINRTKGVAFLYIGRLLVGFSAGMFSYSVPIYLAEIAPQSSRGPLVSAANQVGITVGMLLVYLFGMFSDWRTLALRGILPSSVLILTLILFVPESPWWLAKERIEYSSSSLLDQISSNSLQSLRGHGTDISSELDEIRISVSTATVISPQLMRKRYLAVGLLVFQQLSGINALLFYSSYIFEKTGISNGNIATVCLGVIQVVGTVVATFLIDKAGRRLLFIVSASGMTLILLLAAVAFHLKSDMLSFLGVVGTVIFYSLGVGPIPSLIMSEILPMEINHYNGNITTLPKFLPSWAITMTAILLINWSEGGTFTIYSVLAALTVIVAYLRLPETRGKTCEEIDMLFS